MWERSREVIEHGKSSYYYVITATARDVSRVHINLHIFAASRFFALRPTDRATLNELSQVSSLLPDRNIEKSVKRVRNESRRGLESWRHSHSR